MPNEVKLLPCDRAIAEALSDLKFGMDFAYEQGLHEFGYDPVETVRAALSRPTTVVTDEVVDLLSSERVSLNDRIKQLRAERKLYFDCEGDGVDVLLIDIQDHFDRAASMPTVVTGEQPQDLGDHALPCSASSPVSRSRPKAAAAIARKGA